MKRDFLLFLCLTVSVLNLVIQVVKLMVNNNNDHDNDSMKVRRFTRSQRFWLPGHTSVSTEKSSNSADEEEMFATGDGGDSGLRGSNTVVAVGLEYNDGKDKYQNGNAKMNSKGIERSILSKSEPATDSASSNIDTSINKVESKKDIMESDETEASRMSANKKLPTADINKGMASIETKLEERLQEFEDKMLSAIENNESSDNTRRISSKPQTANNNDLKEPSNADNPQLLQDSKRENNKFSVQQKKVQHLSSLSTKSKPSHNQQPTKIKDTPAVAQVRDAIVVTTSHVTDCLAARLRQLVESSQSSIISGVQRDVWVLHNHYKFDERYTYNETFHRDSTDLPYFQKKFNKPHGLFMDDEFPIMSNDTTLARSQELIASIPGLHSASQSILRIDKFDTKRSGPSKSSFLKLLVQHEYRFGWHMEDDTFFTGQWGDLFDSLDPDYSGNSSSDNINNADVLSVFYQFPGNDWSGFNPCFVGPNRTKKCTTIEKTQIAWFMIRVSGTWAQSLLNDLDPKSRSVWGHHEAIVGPYSKVHNFTVQQIPQNKHVGKVQFGTKYITNKKMGTLKNYSPIVKNRVYHPVKCSAYPPGGLEQDLKQWTSKES